MPWTLCQLGKTVGHGPNYNRSWHHWFVAWDFSWFFIVWFFFLISELYLSFSQPAPTNLLYFHTSIMTSAGSRRASRCGENECSDAWGRRADKGRCCPNRLPAGIKTVSWDLSHKADAAKVFTIEGPQSHQFVHYVSCSTAKLAFKKKKKGSKLSNYLSLKPSLSSFI